MINPCFSVGKDKMTGNRELLFDIIRSELGVAEARREQLVELAADEGLLESLYELAVSQDMAHFVGAALDRCGVLKEESELHKKIRKKYYSSVFRYRGIEHELASVCEILSSGGIKHIPLKGSVLRQLYPEPWMRTSCDIDVLVPLADHDRAAELLVQRLGYKQVAAGSHDVAFDSVGGVHFELHYSLIEKTTFEAGAKILESVWDYAVSDGSSLTYTLSNEMLYFYHIIHMARHFIDGGCGVKPFVDIWVLKHKVGIDSGVASELLERAGLMRFALSAERLASVWLDGAEHTEYTRLMEDYVFSGGTYGAQRNGAELKKAHKGGRLRYVFSRLFIPYDVIKYYYPILQRHKWLTPFYEVKRWFKLFTKRGRQMRELQNDPAKQAEMESMLEYIDLPQK